MKNIVILGSTGSIGTQALDIIRANPDIFKVTGLGIGSNISLLTKQIAEFKPKFVSVENVPYTNDNTIVLRNAVELINNAEADIILLAMVGVSGLKAAYEAVSKGVRIALANKETLVAAGSIIMKKASDCDSEIIPVDSEHSAIWQCLMAGKHNEISRIILTASGGAFRNLDKETLRNVKAKDALKHPVWNMGSKVTIDSATLMNKGLEVIEAMHLFNTSCDKIEVVIHPESIIHSMVEFSDNCIMAEMSKPDMRLPIQLAFTYPDRILSSVSRLDFRTLSGLTFRQPDKELFPCLDIAYNCIRIGGAAPVIMNAANEVAVQLFMNNRIGFYDIPSLINTALDKYNTYKAESIDEIICIDNMVKEYILSLANELR